MPAPPSLVDAGVFHAIKEAMFVKQPFRSSHIFAALLVISGVIVGRLNAAAGAVTVDLRDCGKPLNLKNGPNLRELVKRHGSLQPEASSAREGEQECSNPEDGPDAVPERELKKGGAMSIASLRQAPA